MWSSGVFFLFFNIGILGVMGIHVNINSYAHEIKIVLKKLKAKVEVVVSWKRSTIVIEVQSFLVLIGYYKHFIKGFSKIALLLTKLTQKKTKFIWSYECKCSFEEWKNKLLTTPIFTIPSSSWGYVIFSDASYQGLGCVLT